MTFDMFRRVVSSVAVRLVWTLWLLFGMVAVPVGAQEAADWTNGTKQVDGETARLELSTDELDLSTYEMDLRYRMISQAIGLVIGLVVLHFVQVKLKINRGYFWFMVVGVTFLFVLNSFRPKYDANQPLPSTSDPPTYAPTTVR